MAGPERVLVAIATLDRPVLLRRALLSLDNMRNPAGFVMHVLVVENRSPLTVETMIQGLQREVSFPLALHAAPERGISNARNLAVDYALRGGFDWLCFIDDDEEVDPDWLACLHRSAVQGGLDLAGGACLPVNEIEPLSRGQRFLLDLMTREWRREAALLERALAGAPIAPVYLRTANWMCRVSALRRHNLRFLPELNHCGGEDCAFSEMAFRRGLKQGFAPEALVYETVPASRLNLGYLFRRHRDAAIGDEMRHRLLKGRKHPLRLMAEALLTGGKGIAHLLGAPLLGRAALLRALIRFAICAGKFAWLTGRQSTHYLKTHGF